MFDLVEIFESLQGEGRNAGRQCAFVRFAHCNLSCPWCDTDRERRFSLSAAEIVGELLAFRARSVILTGGEPTLVAGMDSLVAALREAGFWVAVETNGTRRVPWLERVDYVAVSPKAEFPEAYDPETMVRRADEVRVVASAAATVGFLERMRVLIAATDYYVSPCDRDGEIDFAAAKELLGKLSGWSLSVQLHKLLGFR